MAKTKAVKWRVKPDEPEDMQEFLSNEEIVALHGLPPKDTYRLEVRRLSVKPNKNKDDRISAMLVIDEPNKKGKGKWNGYLVWDGFNVTDQGKAFIKRFLTGLGLTWNDFYENSEQDDQDPPHIVRIGKQRFEVDGRHVYVNATLREKQPDDYNPEPYMTIGRYLVKGAGKDAPPAAEPMKPGDGPDLRKQLKKEAKKGGIDQLRMRAVKNGMKGKKANAASDAELIDFIVEKEEPPF